MLLKTTLWMICCVMKEKRVLLEPSGRGYMPDTEFNPLISAGETSKTFVQRSVQAKAPQTEQL